MQSSSSVAYWRHDTPIDVWARVMLDGTPAAGVEVGNRLHMQHGDPSQFRRLADALIRAALGLEELQAEQDVA